MSLNNLSVRFKIIFGMSMPIIFFGAFILFLVSNLKDIKAQIFQIEKESIVYALVAKDMTQDITQVQQYLTDVSATRGKDGLDDGWKEAENNYKEFLVGINKFQKYYETKSDKNQLDAIADIRSKAERFYAQGKKLAAAYVEGGAEMGNTMMPQFDKTSLELQASLKPFVDRQLKQVSASTEKASEEANVLITTSIFLSILVLVLSLAVGIYVTRSINRPLQHILSAIDDLGQGDGDLTYQLPPLGSDFGHISVSLNLFIQKLHNIVSSIRTSSDIIATNSGQIAAGNMELSGAHRRSGQRDPRECFCHGAVKRYGCE
jgi:hypothetical protein